MGIGSFSCLNLSEQCELSYSKMSTPCTGSLIANFYYVNSWWRTYVGFSGLTSLTFTVGVNLLFENVNCLFEVATSPCVLRGLTV